MSNESTISMNEELRKWIVESKEKIQQSKIKKSKSKKPLGKCQICGEKDAEAVCLKCNKSVCKSCYFKLIGICKKCVPPEIAGKWDGSKTDWEKELGVEWVD
jgi:hypothetical protein